MGQASPDAFQAISVRITAHEKIRVAHALAELPGGAAPPPPLPAYTSMTYDEPAVHGYRNADLRG